MCRSVGPNTSQGHPENLDVSNEKEKFKRRIRFELEATGVPEKAIAVEAKLDPGFVSKAVKAGAQEAFHIHTLPAITRELGPGLMEWTAIQCGGTYIHGMEARHIEAAPTALMGMLAHNSGEVLQQMLQALQDGKIDAGEYASLLPVLRKLHLVIESPQADAEGGAQ